MGAGGCVSLRKPVLMPGASKCGQVLERTYCGRLQKASIP